MGNPTLTYDNEYNRRLADILANYDDIEASRNSPTMIIGGMRQKKYVDSGNTPYDGREGTASFSVSKYGGVSSGGEMSGGKVNRMKKAKKWTAFAKSLVPPSVQHALENVVVSNIGKLGGASCGGMECGCEDCEECGAMSGGVMSGGKVNRMKKAKKWTAFAKSLVPPSVQHALESAVVSNIGKLGAGVSGGEMSGGKVNRMKKAKKWTAFAKSLVPPSVQHALESAVVSNIGKLGGAKSGGKKLREAKMTGYGKPNPWITHVKAYCMKHGCSYREGLKLASPSYKK